MKIKTMAFINICATAISTCTSAISLVLDKAHDDPEVNAKAASLNAKSYLLISESMTTVRELLKEMPDQLLDETLNKLRVEFYLHLFSEEQSSTHDLHNLVAVHTAAHDLHSRIFKILNDARDACELYL